MTAYRILPVNTETAQAIRARRADGHGNALDPIPAESGYPCRHCLRDAAPGEPMLLLSYSPFTAPGPFKEVGPVFLHAGECQAYGAGKGQSGRLPPVVESRTVQMRAYDPRNRIVYPLSRVVEGAEAGKHLEVMLADDRTAYVHIRSALNGCYICRAERAV